MTVPFARALMSLAVRCLGEHRRDWGLAMEVEFDAACVEGKQLSFALGCLLAGWRELPAHEEGRFTIASHALALVLLIPMAALLVATMITAFPASYLGGIDGFAMLGAIGGPEPLLSDANLSVVPLLAALLALIAASHVRIAWLILDRDWARVAGLGSLLAAATVTLTLFSAIVFASFVFPVAQTAALAVELAAIRALVQWHARSFASAAELGN